MFQHRTLNGGDIGTEMEGLRVTWRLCKLLVSRTGRHQRTGDGCVYRSVARCSLPYNADWKAAVCTAVPAAPNGLYNTLTALVTMVTEVTTAIIRK